MTFKHHNQSFIFAITGGGSEFISDILSAGGASQYLVHAEIPYANESLQAFTGGLRYKACSESSARQMAVASELKGISLGYPQSIGIGATSSLAKENEREGRENSIFVAAKHKGFCFSLEWRKRADAHQDRAAQEILAAHLIKSVSQLFSEYVWKKSHLVKCDLREVMGGLLSVGFCGDVVLNYPSEFAVDSVISSNVGRVSFYSEDCFKNFTKQKEKNCIYPGSWCPVHDDHIRVFRKCEELYGAENCFAELSLSNFDKPDIDSIEATQRVEQMRKMTGNILITKEPLIKNKVKTLSMHGHRSKMVFATGFDTFARVEPDCPASFLIFPRDGKSAHDAKGLTNNEIEKESFNLEEGFNLKSSELRKNS